MIDKKPMRILHVSGRMDKGGAECRNMDIYREIDRAKIQYDFLTHVDYKCFFDDEINSLGGNVYGLPRLNWKNYFKYKKALNDFFSTHKQYKVIHGHMTSNGFIYHKIAKKHGIHVRIAHSRCGTNKVNFTFKNKIRNICHILLRPYVTHKFAVSKLAGENVFGKKAVSNGEVRIIPNAIKTDIYTYDKNKRLKIREKLNINDDTFLIGHVGRFEEQKNHNFLLDIFKKIHNKNSNTKLMLVGGYGTLQEIIKEKTKQLELENNVIFMGVRNDVPDLMQAMDMLLFPSFMEGFPGVVLESQASGLKCIVSDTITKEVNLTGLVEYISLKKPDKYWADKTIDIINNGYNRRNTYDDIVKKGYDIKNVAKWYEDFYLKLK